MAQAHQPVGEIISAPTRAVIAFFQTFQKNGQVVIEWQTASEIGTAGFNVYKLEQTSQEYVKLNKGILSSLLTSPQGGIYRFLDPTVAVDGASTYKLEEIEAREEDGVFTGLLKWFPLSRILSQYITKIHIKIFLRIIP